MIDPEFWSDEKIGTLPVACRIMFIGMWNFADDEGIIRFTSAFLKAMIFSYDNISMKKIKSYMEILENNEFVISYTGGIARQKYAYIINFRRYQRIDKPQPSKLPPPPIKNHRIFTMYIKRDREICHICNELIEYSPHINRVGSKTPSLDHVIPKCKGGSDYPSNIKLAHLSCNKSKSGRLINSENDSENDSCLREKNIREENIKEENQEPSAVSNCSQPVDKALESLKKQVHDKGFNISVLINRFKKDQRARKVTYAVPDEVYIAVCETVLKTDLSRIKSNYPYFMRILKAKSEEFFANNAQSEHSKVKNANWAISISDIMKGAK